MSDAPKPLSTADLLMTLIDEIRGLRADMRLSRGLPDVKLGKSKKHPEYEGKAASECPSDFLIEHAEFLEWKADKNRAEGNMGYVARDEREALMCRRWAAVNRDVKAPPKPSFRKAEEPSGDAAPVTNPSEPAKTKWSSGNSGWAQKKASGT